LKTVYLVVIACLFHEHSRRMITALRLIFSPFETWEKITTAERGFWWTLCVELLPMLVIALGIEGYLLTKWGEKRGEFGGIINVSQDQAVRYAAAYFVMLLASIFVSAKFLTWASESFNVRAGYLPCFTLMAYGFGPIILVRILDGIPLLNTWLCWAIGAATAVSVLYHGIGMVLRPEQTKGFGLYLIAIFVIVFMSALAHFAAVSFLHGKMLHPRTTQIDPVSWAPPVSV
jgi:hypothetical protein